MGSWIGITLIEVRGASACGGLEAEGQEYFALCLSEALLNQKYRLSTFDTHHSMWIAHIYRTKIPINFTIVHKFGDVCFALRASSSSFSVIKETRIDNGYGLS